jgi:hypothetical protein
MGESAAARPRGKALLSSITGSITNNNILNFCALSLANSFPWPVRRPPIHYALPTCSFNMPDYDKFRRTSGLAMIKTANAVYYMGMANALYDKAST